MKTSKILLLFLILVLNSCSSDNSDSALTPDTESKFAMTANVDGNLWEVNNPFNSNFATKPLFNYYPASDFIQFQGRNGFEEIRLLIKRSDLKVGVYPITAAKYDGSKTQIEVSMALSKQNLQEVIEGNLAINSIDLSSKIVAGTFSFNCVEDDSKPISSSNPITTKVTNGIFKFKYDVAY